MSRDPLPSDPAEEAQPPEPRGPDDGGLGLTDPRALLVLFTGGLVLGWLVRPLTRWQSWTTPVAGWLQILGLALAAVVLGAAAWQTRRAVRHRRGQLRSFQAVNRLVLGKACALVGAGVAGGYAGAALSWVGAVSELAEENIVRSLLAAGAAALLGLAGLLLERACRIQDGPPPS